MEQKELNNKKAVLTFEGKKYVIEDLPKEVKEIIKNLQIADAQLKLHEDNLKLISLGRNSLTDNLRKRLDSLNL
tara:strand:+ start:1409 stop:1630 length:222 start_codon:yes stop_codon:yes gene_type:complete